MSELPRKKEDITEEILQVLRNEGLLSAPEIKERIIERNTIALSSPGTEESTIQLRERTLKALAELERKGNICAVQEGRITRYALGARDEQERVEETYLMQRRYHQGQL
mgnify:CR=1 FL=1